MAVAATPKRAILIATIMTVLGYLLLMGTVPLAFDTVDDPSFVLVLAGRMGGTPSSYPVLQNIILTTGLSSLAAAFPIVPWYTTHLVLAHAVAAGGFLYVLFRSRRSVVTIIAGALWLVLVESYVLLQLQYTHASVALVSVGLALLVRREEPRFVRAVGCAMVVVGSMERNEGLFLSVLVMTVPLLVATATRGRRAWLLGTLATGILLVAVNAIWTRSHDGWRAHREWVRPVAALMGGFEGHNLSSLPQVLADVGWTTNDWTLFMEWFHEDPAVFQTADLYVLRDRLMGRRPMRIVLEMAWKQLRHPFTGIGHLWSLIGILAILVAAGRLSSQRRSVIALAICLPAVAVVVGLLSYARLPPRVGLAAVYALGVSLLPVLLETTQVSLTPFRRGAIGFLTVLLLLLGARHVAARGERNAAERAEAVAIEHSLLNEPDALYLLMDWRALKGVSPWNRHRLGVQLLPVATFSRSPVMVGALRQVNGGPFIERLGTHPAIRIVGTEDFLRRLSEHMLTHHGRLLRYVVQGRWNDLVSVSVATG